MQATASVAITDFPTAMNPMQAGFKQTWLSNSSGCQPPWSVAVFAHNEAKHIRSALSNLAQAAAGHPVSVTVLANGCADATTDEVRACAGMFAELSLVEIDLADKANAWNVYVHESLSPTRAEEVVVHFFVDGDIRVGPRAFPLLAASLDKAPGARAAGGMPTTGRDRDAWRTRMLATGVLAGGLYALRGGFLRQLRDLGLRLPVGFIGEDWLVAHLAASLPRETGATGAPLVFNQAAGFSFRSLSPARPADYLVLLRRKRRYALRALQYEMLMNALYRDGLGAMPRHVRELYLYAPLPGRGRWVGLDTPFRLLALQSIRRFRRTHLSAL